MSELTQYTPRTLWDPFQSLGDMRNEFDRLFNGLRTPYMEKGGFSPVVEWIS